MYYNSSTDSYTNEFMEPLLDTGFYSDVPYKIDKTKYDEIAKGKSRFTYADVVEIQTEYSIKKNETDPWLYTIFVFPINKKKGDFYDCFHFEDFHYHNEPISNKDAYEKFLKNLTTSILGVDSEHTKKAINKKLEESKKISSEIEKLNNLL